MKSFSIAILAAIIFLPAVSHGLIGGDGLSGGGGASGGFSIGGVFKFGGKVRFMRECTCSPGITLLYIGPPKGGVFTLSSLTRIYDNKKPFSGSWVIGEYVPTGASSECYVWVGKACVPVTSQGSIKRIGTS